MMNDTSREYIYEKGTIANKALLIHFITGTESQRIWGDFVVISPIWDNLEEMIINYNKGLNTYGKVKAKILVTDNFTPYHKIEIEEVGFNTRDILTISITD